MTFDDNKEEIKKTDTTTMAKLSFDKQSGSPERGKSIFVTHSVRQNGHKKSKTFIQEAGKDKNDFFPSVRHTGMTNKNQKQSIRIPGKLRNNYFTPFRNSGTGVQNRSS